MQCHMHDASSLMNLNSAVILPRLVKSSLHSHALLSTTKDKPDAKPEKPRDCDAGTSSRQTANERRQEYCNSHHY